MTDDLGIPYGLRRGPSGELGLLIEGCRHNLLLHSNDIEKLIPELRDVRSGTVRSIFAGETCAAFSCDTTQSFSISFEVENSLQRSDFSVSLFGVLASLPLKDAASTIPVPFEMSVSDGRETKVTTGCLEKEWRRHDCGFHFASRPRRLSCAFRTLPNRVLLTPIAYQFSLTGLCAEEGLFPSMPIVTNGAIGVRAPDRLSFSGSEALSQFKSAGTLVLVYRPQWTPSQLTPGINPCVFEALFDEGQQGIRLVHDSHNNAQLRLDVWGDGGKTIKSFDGNRPPPSNDVFAIYFGWENQKFSLRLDGDLVFEGELDRSISELDEFYLASRKGDDEASLFAHLKQFSIYSEIIGEEAIRAKLFMLDPGIYAKFQNEYMSLIEESACPLTGEELRPIAELLLRTAAGWVHLGQTFDDEAGYRDSCALSMFAQGLVQSRESLTSGGETDLTIHLPQVSDALTSRDIRIEFKLWPRNDYKEVPTKPLKYMSEFDTIGAVFMIAHHKHKDVRQEFKEIVCSNVDYPYVNDWDQPFGTGLPYHFVTQHRDPSTNTDKFILNVLISVAL